MSDQSLEVNPGYKGPDNMPETVPFWRNHFLGRLNSLETARLVGGGLLRRHCTHVHGLFLYGYSIFLRFLRTSLPVLELVCLFRLPETHL
jgi:hypothetical protein